MTTPEHQMTDAELPTLIAAIPNASSPVAGIITAGQPTAAQLEALARSGIAIVIDLRATNEARGFDEPSVAARAGMEYHNIPVTSGAIGPREFDAVRAALGTRRTRQVLVHCASANRVGAALIPFLVLDEHRPDDEARRIAREIGLRSDEMARAAFAYVHDQSHSA